MGVPAKKLDFDEIVKNLNRLTPDERETLAILCDPKLAREIRKADREAVKELREGKTIPLENFLKEL
jgi:hypothetical protein